MVDDIRKKKSFIQFGITELNETNEPSYTMHIAMLTNNRLRFPMTLSHDESILGQRPH